MYMYGGHFWGMHWVWWLVFCTILIWIFIIPKDIPGQRHSKERAIDILDKRFAKGEISKEEYEEKKKLIQKN